MRALHDSHPLHVASLILVLSAAGCAANTEPEATQPETALAAQALACRREIPAALAVPDGNRLAFEWSAVGQQVYACRASATGYEWALKAPDADLFNHRHLVGSHYAGPTWEALDGSTVVGARVASYSADATAVPWLLLSAASHSGSGRMSTVSFIQRLDTTAGLAPSGGCDAAHLDAVQGVDYTANYLFYVPSRSR